jgi:hypothetical protein
MSLRATGRHEAAYLRLTIVGAAYTMAREWRFLDDASWGQLFVNSFCSLMLCSLAAPLPRRGSGSAIFHNLNKTP